MERSDGTGSEPVIHERPVKTVIRKSILPEAWFVSRFRAAPYMACAHGCLYCDGRAEKYYVEGTFDRDITVRSNFAEVFEADLSRLRERAAVSFGSGITDPYQPVEAERLSMRRAAELLATRRMPATVLTKSSLALRDLDLWSRIGRDTGMILMMSVTTVDDTVRRIFEPGASSVDERFATLEAFKNAGCGAGILAMPFLPGISDGEESIDALVRRAAGIGVDFVMPAGLTLRPGRQKDLYMETLRRSHPGLVGLYLDLYHEERQSGAPVYPYRRELQDRAGAVLGRYGMSRLVPHRVYRSMLPLYDEIFLLMSHMAELYADAAKDTRRLVGALKRYEKWLTGRKREFNRRRSQSQADLENELRHILKGPEAGELFGNRKLEEFLREVVFGGKWFDYGSLSLREITLPERPAPPL